MANKSGPESDAAEEVPGSSATGKAETPTENIGTFASLSIPNFRWLLTGTIFSNAAQWIQQVTVSWLRR